MADSVIQEYAEEEAGRLANIVKSGHLDAAIEEINADKANVGKTAFDATLAELSYDLHKAGILSDLDIVDVKDNRLVVQDGAGNQYLYAADGKQTPVAARKSSTDSQLAPADQPRPQELPLKPFTFKVEQNNNPHAEKLNSGTSGTAHYYSQYDTGIPVSDRKISHHPDKLNLGTSEAAHYRWQYDSGIHVNDRAAKLEGGCSVSDRAHGVTINLDLKMDQDFKDSHVSQNVQGMVRHADGRNTPTVTHLDGNIETQNGRRYYEGWVSNANLQQPQWVKFELKHR